MVIPHPHRTLVPPSPERGLTVRKEEKKCQTREHHKMHTAPAPNPDPSSPNGGLEVSGKRQESKQTRKQTNKQARKLTSVKERKARRVSPMKVENTQNHFDTNEGRAHRHKKSRQSGCRGTEPTLRWSRRKRRL